MSWSHLSPAQRDMGKHEWISRRRHVDSLEERGMEGVAGSLKRCYLRNGQSGTETVPILCSEN